MTSVALTPYTGNSGGSGGGGGGAGFSSDHSHTPTGEWERLVRAAAREQRQDMQHEAQQARLARIKEGRAREQGSQTASPTSPYQVAASPSIPDSFFGQQARVAPHTPALRPGGFPGSDATMPSAAVAASPSPVSNASFAYASLAGSPTAAPTPAVLAGVQSCLGSLLRLAQGEAALDAIRERLHALPCVRPLNSESLQFPGGIEEDEAMRGGFKPGSWISRRAAASVPLFQRKLHTTLHAVSGLPTTSEEAPAVFVPNTYFLWLLFTNLDSTGKGYVSVEDYALYLAKHCRAPPQQIDEQDNLDGFEGSPLAARALASNHRAQLDMERYLNGEDGEDGSGLNRSSSGGHFTPYYPISPFRNSNQHAGIAAAVEAGQQAQHQSSPSYARDSRALDESYAFLSPPSRKHPAQSNTSNLLRPPMPSPEDILALFRKHDRASHGRLGFVKFCRAFLPLLPSHGINDEFETALAALPQQFSHFVEAAEVGPPEARPTVAANGVLSPAKESQERTTDGGAAVPENGTPWSSPSPPSLRSRLSLAQESLVLRLLLAELRLESQLNFEDCNLSLMGQGQGAAREWSDYALQLQGADPFRAPKVGFDLIALYSYLSACSPSDADEGGDDGFLSRVGLSAAFDRFGMEADARELAYMIHRLDRDADGKVVYTDFAECFLPYAANLLPYDPEARASSDGAGAGGVDADARRIQPRQPFPFLSLPVPPADLMRRLLHPPVASLSAADQAALRERAEDEAEMERQARRAEQLRQQAVALRGRTDEEILEDGEKREDEYYAQQQQQQQQHEAQLHHSPQHFQAQHQTQTQTQDRRQVSFEQPASASPQRPLSSGQMQYPDSGDYQFAPPGSQQTSFAATQFRSPSSVTGAGVSVSFSPINRTASVSPSSQQQHQQGSFVRTPQYNPPPQLFHRPVTRADGQQAASTLNAVVAGMAPELSSALPQGFPFVLHPPQEAPAPPVSGVLASALPRSSDGKSIEQVRAEQLATYHQFAAHAAVQNQQVEQHARARDMEREIKEQAWSPLQHSGEQAYAPMSPSARPQLQPQLPPPQFSPSRRSASPYTIPTLQPHVRMVPGSDGGVAVDVWYQQDPQQQQQQQQRQQQAYIPSVTSPSRYSSPHAAAANAAVATALAPGSLWSRAPPTQSAVVAGSSSIQTSNSSLARAASTSAALPLHDARFAPSYPLRFPVETLASQVHQTLYFPIPLAVPSAMLPLSDASLVGGGGRLAAEISQQAVVASLAGAQARANQAVRAEQMRKAAFQANVQRITQSLAAQMHSNAQALAQPPSISQARASGAAYASILPMNHQNTYSSYRGTGLGGPAASEFTAATWAAAERAENVPASTSFIHPSIYSRPLGPSIYRPLDPSDPNVNLPRQRAVQAVSLESIHAHRVSLQAADEAARDADIRAQQAEMQESMRRHTEQLYELRQTHRDLNEAREEKQQWDETQHEAAMAMEQQPWGSAARNGGATGSPSLSRLNSLSATGGTGQQQQGSSVLSAAVPVATGGAGGASGRGSIGREGAGGPIASGPVDVDIGGRRATSSAGGFAAGGPPSGGFSAATAAAAAARRGGRAGSPTSGHNSDAADDGQAAAAPRSSHTFARVALPAPARTSLAPPPVTSARAFAGAPPSAASLLTPAAAPKPQFLHLHELASPSPMQPPRARASPEPPTTGSKPLSKLQAAIAGSKLASQGNVNDVASPTRNLTSSFK